MSILFRPLLTVAVNHGYYGGACGDLDFVIPAATAAALARGRILARVRDNRMVLLSERRPDGTPLADLAGTTLLFGLRLNNPYFSNFTEPPVPAGLPVYSNRTAPGQFAAPLAARFAAASETVVPSQATRPVTLSLRAGATLLETQTLAAGVASVVFSTRHLPTGVYTLAEDYGGPPVASTWVVEPELAAGGVWGLAAITLGAAFQAAPPAFTLTLAARQERLKYYVVARNFSAGEFSQLLVTDAGFGEEGRPQLLFEPVAPAAFAGDDIKADLLGDAAARIVLFQSQAPVSRRDKGYRKIQLSRNGEILVTHLPQPGADRPQAHLIVHLSKP